MSQAKSIVDDAIRSNRVMVGTMRCRCIEYAGSISYSIIITPTGNIGPFGAIHINTP
jgi:hypothetical protein